eukprot:Nk52_evm5s684 gene=Nk52_evmTU5s684
MGGENQENLKRCVGAEVKEGPYMIAHGCSDGLEESLKDKTNIRAQMEDTVLRLQREICDALSRTDGKEFTVDQWKREAGGGGVSCVLQDGEVFEKAGVNVSVVYGMLPPAALEQMRARGKNLVDLGRERSEGLEFFATGVSLVVHGRNPHVPTVHLNYRYFEIEQGEGLPKVWWFGGGCDLTPSYFVEEDCVKFHREMKRACDQTDAGYYPRFKKWADEYFHIKHRGERRGIGGIFYDDLDDKDPQELIQFSLDCGRAFIPAYIPIAERHREAEFTPEQKEWQQLRRGRYVEFNLVYDRGTKFGLATPGARIESILMSLPLTCRFEYMHSPEEGTPEGKMMGILKTPREYC